MHWDQVAFSDSPPSGSTSIKGMVILPYLSAKACCVHETKSMILAHLLDLHRFVDMIFFCLVHGKVVFEAWRYKNSRSFIFHITLI